MSGDSIVSRQAYSRPTRSPVLRPRIAMNESQQLLRQWKLLQLLAESRVGFTMQELVETFEVSLRSIQRDIAVLQSAGFPLENVTAERNLKRWKMRPFSEQTGFNFADMISIVMSRRFLEPLAGTPFWEGHQKVYRKVRGAMGEQALRFCEQLNQTIRVSGFGTSDYTKRGQTIDKILQAMEDRRRVLVGYQSQEATEPIETGTGATGFIWHNGSLYLIAWSTRREEIRNYKVDRIQSAEIGSDLRYTVPEDFSLEDCRSEPLESFGATGISRGPFESTSHARPLVMCRNHGGMTASSLSPCERAVEMRLELNDLSSVTKWILSFGSNATALAHRNSSNGFAASC